MNLPLQMHAVSRGYFPKPRAKWLSGGVVPSWIYVCDPPLVACGCAGTNSVACCTAGKCTCTEDGVPGCLARGGPPTDSVIVYPEGALGHCHDAKQSSFCKKAKDISCFDKSEVAHTCGN